MRERLAFIVLLYLSANPQYRKTSLPLYKFFPRFSYTSIIIFSISISAPYLENKKLKKNKSSTKKFSAYLYSQKIHQLSLKSSLKIAFIFIYIPTTQKRYSEQFNELTF